MKSRASSSSRPDVTPRAVARGVGEIRIIGGQWRRTRLAVLDRQGLRPTPDRVRETLFNWLGQSLEGWRCADVFAGTGALGLEAASRGATQVVLCEQDRALAQQLQQHLTRLNATQASLVTGDGVHWLRQQAGAGWDLVFLDPPFAADWFEAALQAAAQAIGPQGLIYLEAPRAWDAQALVPLGLGLHRYLHAGAVHAHLLSRLEIA
jgi:16S rRNA (guanine966-N2)-methyltransferase